MKRTMRDIQYRRCDDGLPRILSLLITGAVEKRREASGAARVGPERGRSGESRAGVGCALRRLGGCDTYVVSCTRAACVLEVWAIERYRYWLF